MSDVRPFMVRKSERRTTRGPKPKLYYTGTLFDKDETYDFKLWDDAAALLVDPAPGDVLAGPWEFKEFNGGLQAELRVKPTVTVAAEVPDLAPYLRVSYLSKDAWLQYYNEKIKVLVEDEPIREIIDLAVVRGTKFWLAPAAKGMHHPFRGGLAEHVHHILRLYEGLVFSGHPQVDQARHGLVVFGIIFHDYAKMFEYEEIAPGQFDVSRWGSLLGHLAGGPIFLERIRVQAGIKVSNELWMHMMHVLLSHHGRVDFGSPIVPATLEAMLVHYLDELDGRLWQVDNTADGTRHRGLGTNVIHFQPDPTT